MKGYIKLIVVISAGMIISGCNQINQYNHEVMRQSELVKMVRKLDREEVTKDTSNPFFFNDDCKNVMYQGEFSLGEGVITKDINLSIKEVAQLKEGKLYELKIQKDETLIKEGLDINRLDLGYFYVQADKIYRCTSSEENLKLLANNVLPKESEIVCQNKPLKDRLNEEEKGWHHYIEVNDNQIASHGYSNLVETGYYETFIWEKEGGLIAYRSGWGAGRDHIGLSL